MTHSPSGERFPTSPRVKAHSPLLAGCRFARHSPQGKGEFPSIERMSPPDVVDPAVARAILRALVLGAMAASIALVLVQLPR